MAFDDMNEPTPNNKNDMSTTHTQHFSNRRWSIVLFLAVLVGIAQFGLGQFSPWVIAAPFGEPGSGDMKA